MKFIKLMKGVLKIKTKAKAKKARFSWALDENKYLKLNEVKRLRKTCRKERDSALKNSKTTAVRNWFMIELGLNAGLRVSEMVNLKCADLLIENEQSSIITRGKKDKKRAV